MAHRIAQDHRTFYLLLQQGSPHCPTIQVAVGRKPARFIETVSGKTPWETLDRNQTLNLFRPHGLFNMAESSEMDGEEQLEDMSDSDELHEIEPLVLTLPLALTCKEARLAVYDWVQEQERLSPCQFVPNPGQFIRRSTPHAMRLSSRALITPNHYRSERRLLSVSSCYLRGSTYLTKCSSTSKMWR
ncbi:hypothetical protein K461DRAFT_275230 [Myriangium duriaei CBS 260.36]|uniref:Uncharacterized protein n=1 Tax=Myriangium duriaei CBS 260.36 TaxID=1168546 RepID=A0A9P4J753_9PEZI|nr:hypothetical protein K461DRAFT_275230 [Myriangium duriaei CBS 260.36]